MINPVTDVADIAVKKATDSGAPVPICGPALTDAQPGSPVEETGNINKKVPMATVSKKETVNKPASLDILTSESIDLFARNTRPA